MRMWYAPWRKANDHCFGRSKLATYPKNGPMEPLAVDDTLAKKTSRSKWSTKSNTGNAKHNYQKRRPKPVTLDQTSNKHKIYLFILLVAFLPPKYSVNDNIDDKDTF